MCRLKTIGHQALGKERLDSVYGCNMAFIDNVICKVRFDENAPLYGWLEDRDYTGAAQKLGRVIYYSNCRGVHLGTQNGGRAHGVRFGYSQIANPAYFFKKRTMSATWTAKFICRALASNIIHSLARIETIDYRGRLRGNILAVLDFLRFRLDPKRILSL